MNTPNMNTPNMNTPNMNTPNMNTPNTNTPKFTLTALVAALLVGCGGGGGGGAAVATSSMSGVLVDGYLQGAVVCLDKNKNGVCDPGEPVSTATDATGAYTITGITPGEETKFPLVAQIPATAIDADTKSAVGQAFTLTAPASSVVVSPLTTLVQESVQAGIPVAQADAAVVAAMKMNIASGVSALENYVKLKGAAVDQDDLHFRAHEAAKTVAEVLKKGKQALASNTASTDQATQSVLVEQASNAVLFQAASNVAATATMFQSGVVASTTAATLKAQIAANSVVAAAATQAVTLNFDVVNGATAVGTTGCTTPFTLGNAPAVVGGTAGGSTGTLSDLRFYVSNVSLIDAAGNYTPVIMTENANQGRNVALLDFETATGTCSVATGTPATYTAITGLVKPGSYVGVAFTVGVPVLSRDAAKTQLNHSDTLATFAKTYSSGQVVQPTPLPLQNVAMAWAWQSGRKFTKIEFTVPAVALGAVNPATGVAAPAAVLATTTMVHLGSTGCVGNPMLGDVTACSSPNRMSVTLASGFNPATNKIALDLGSLYGGLNLFTNQTWMSGKAGMMAMQAPYFFNKFDLDIVTGLPLKNAPAQTLFVIK